MKRIFVATCILALLAPGFLSAVLGESEVASKAKQEEWRKEFGAVDPMIETDINGKVIFECWSGPPEGWDQSTALRFAQKLLPAHARETKPKRIVVEDSNNAFEVGQAYRIYLSDFQGRVYNLEVSSIKYTGYRC